MHGRWGSLRTWSRDWLIPERTEMEEETPEFLLLRKNRGNLELALRGNISVILDDLHDANLLSHDVYEKLKDPEIRQSPVEEVELVISCLLNKVKLKASYLKEFITLLSKPKRKSRYKDVIELLMVGKYYDRISDMLQHKWRVSWSD